MAKSTAKLFLWPKAAQFNAHSLQAFRKNTQEFQHPSEYGFFMQQNSAILGGHNTVEEEIRYLRITSHIHPPP